MSEDLDRFVAAGPPALRLGLRALLAVARRPRGSRLLERTPRLHTPALAALSLERYDDPVVSRALGFDADAVAARGRALRHAEGRP